MIELEGSLIQKGRERERFPASRHSKATAVMVKRTGYF